MSHRLSESQTIHLASAQRHHAAWEELQRSVTGREDFPLGASFTGVAADVEEGEVEELEEHAEAPKASKNR